MNVNPTEVKSVLKSLLSIYMQDRERKLNYTNPSLVQQEEISASLYILIIIGFFGFLLFSMMLSNIVLRQRENYMDYLFQNKFPRKRISSCNSIMVHAGKGVTIEANTDCQCQKTDSCPMAEIPSMESVQKNV
uniref:Uncharacterized protein n=1 Tax=Pseudonaja textilis TaxID=8673 RepID=A0A670XPW1_PSETE